MKKPAQGGLLLIWLCGCCSFVPAIPSLSITGILLRTPPPNSDESLRVPPDYPGGRCARRTSDRTGISWSSSFQVLPIPYPRSYRRTCRFADRRECPVRYRIRTRNASTGSTALGPCVHVLRADRSPGRGWSSVPSIIGSCEMAGISPISSFRWRGLWQLPPRSIRTA